MGIVGVLAILIPIAFLISIVGYVKVDREMHKKSIIKTEGTLFYVRCNLCNSEWLGREKDKGTAVRKLRTTTYCTAGSHSAYPNLFSHISIREVKE